MPILALDGLVKSYGALRVVDGVSLSLEAGEAVGLLGPNGAGKTTIFNLVAGTASVDLGRILFDGRDVTRLSARARCRLGLARSFQIPHPFTGLTTFENVLAAATFGGGLDPRAAADRAIDVLEATRLIGKANALASALTLLDRKRLELARALATGPQLLLLDEIAGGLTEAECHDLIAAIRDLRSRGVTIVWIEHVVHALLAVVDRLVVLDAGRMIASGDPATVMASREVASVYMGLEGEAHG